MQIWQNSGFDSRKAADFGSALEEAQEQLDWGTDLEDLRTAWWSLALFDSSHVLVRQLDRKIARLAIRDACRAHSNLPNL